MGFNQFSEVVQPAKYMEPVPLEYLLKGSVYKQQNQEKNLQKIQSEIDMVGNLPTLPGADTEVKNQILGEMTKKLKDVGIQDLSSPMITSQIHGLISSVTNNPDFQNVVKRGYDYQKLRKKYEDLTSKGEYVAPYNMVGMQKFNDYINQGKYIRNTDLSGDIYKSPDRNKAIEEAAKLVAEKTGIDLDRYGWDELYKQKKQADLQEGINAFLSPEVKADFQREFDYSFGKEDLHGLRVGEFQNDYNNTMAIAEEAYSQGNNLLGDAFKAKANSIKDVIETETPEQAKQYYVNKHFGEYVNKVSNAMAYKNIQSLHQDQAYNAALDLSNKKEIARYNALLDAGLVENPNKPGEFIPAKSSYNKTNQDIQLELGSLQDFQSNYKEGIGAEVKDIPQLKGFHKINTPPAIFNSDAFKRKTTQLVPKEATKDKDGNYKVDTWTPKVEDTYPEYKLYNPDTDTYALVYQDSDSPTGFKVEKLKGEQGVKDFLVGKSSTYAKYFGERKGKTNTENKQTKSHPLPQGNPRTVKQGATTFEWSEETGKYEPK